MTSAFLLHRYDWSESSAILDLFTREQGRVVVVAKGAKRPDAQLRSVLMPFQRLNVHYGRRRSRGGADDQAAEVQPLKTAEWAGGPAPAGGAALMTGFYLNELLMKLLARHDPHPTLFDAYALTLPALGSVWACDRLREKPLSIAASRRCAGARCSRARPSVSRSGCCCR
jgi:DNA repair protein RecO (recombination protein O)